jgi:hypothetical protein
MVMDDMWPPVEVGGKGAIRRAPPKRLRCRARDSQASPEGIASEPRYGKGSARKGLAAAAPSGDFYFSPARTTASTATSTVNATTMSSAFVCVGILARAPASGVDCEAVSDLGAGQVRDPGVAQPEAQQSADKISRRSLVRIQPPG